MYYLLLFSFFLFSNEPKTYKNRAKKEGGGNTSRWVMIGFASNVIYVAYVAILLSPLWPHSICSCKCAAYCEPTISIKYAKSQKRMGVQAR